MRLFRQKSIVGGFRGAVIETELNSDSILSALGEGSNLFRFQKILALESFFGEELRTVNSTIKLSSVFIDNGGKDIGNAVVGNKTNLRKEGKRDLLQRNIGFDLGERNLCFSQKFLEGYGNVALGKQRCKAFLHPNAALNGVMVAIGCLLRVVALPRARVVGLIAVK